MDPTTADIEDPSEKLPSLKSPNTILLKEIVEKRQEVGTLLESLESEFTRSESQAEMFKAELAEFQAENEKLNREKEGVEKERNKLEVELKESELRYKSVVRSLVEMQEQIDLLESELKSVKMDHGDCRLLLRMYLRDEEDYE